MKLLVLLLTAILLFGACSSKKQLAGNAKLVPAQQERAPVIDAFHPYYQRPYYYPRLAHFQPAPIPKPKILTYKDCYEIAYGRLQDMLLGNEAVDFEKAVFITENAYYRNQINYDEFQIALKFHEERIKAFIEANDKSATMDFRALVNFRDPGFDHAMLRYTEPERKELYRKALTNWAIFTYLTDTIHFSQVVHLPYSYKIEDPFAINDWANSQVMHLLGSEDKKGNCFALAALFKIFANRLNSEAYICTAPNHIYIQHRDQRGDFYNLDLATGTFPSNGLLQTLTFTYHEGIMSGVSLRKLKEEKQNIILCLINLGKGYEYQFQTKDDDFILNCAELALKYDNKSLNAMLLKEQVLEERVVKYALEHQITDVNALQKDSAISETYKQAEAYTIHLYDVGYRQMPRYMQEMILAVIQRKYDKKIFVRDRTPNPFTSINVPAKSRRYSTVSGGLYEEVHPRRDFEEYRRFTIDTRSKRIININFSTQPDFLIDPVVFAMSVDPLTKEMPTWSPYTAFADNPIFYIDPNGKKFLNFDANGNYIGTSHDNFFHNLFVGTKGRILNANDQYEKFSFADPKQDAADIQNGIIKSIVRVNASDISLMMARAGAYNSENKTANRSLANRYDYILQEGVGNGKLDFSYTAIPKMYPGASPDPLDKSLPATPMMFLVGNVAHNHMNFGNFLFGVAGGSMGFTFPELAIGAHYNSLKNPETNGYKSQFDSHDDQTSIRLGYRFAIDNKFDKKEFKIEVGPLSTDSDRK